MNRLRSSLAPFTASMRDADPNGARHAAADLMRDTGMIILDPAWIDSWGDREFVKATANKALRDYGKRGK